MHTTRFNFVCFCYLSYLDVLPPTEDESDDTLDGLFKKL